jgi:hypothetical protein
MIRGLKTGIKSDSSRGSTQEGAENQELVSELPPNTEHISSTSLEVIPDGHLRYGG